MPRGSIYPQKYRDAGLAHTGRAGYSSIVTEMLLELAHKGLRVLHAQCMYYYKW